MNSQERLPWFPCEPGPLLGALAGMRAPKQLVYIVMLLRIYECGGASPDTLDAIATRTKLNKRVVSDALDELFRENRLVRDGGGIANPKATKVIAESQALFKKRKSASQKAGLASAEKRKEKQGNEPTSRSTIVPQTSTHLHLQEQDSLFTSVNRAPEKPEPKPKTKLEIERKELFDRGKEILGPSGGGMVQNLLAAKHGNIALARAALEQASTMDNPRQYVGGIVKVGKNGKASNALGGFSGLSGKLRPVIAEEDAGDYAAGPESSY